MTASADVVVLGAGPAGLMAARRLAETGRSVVVLERAESVGGMAGSFSVDGVRVDFGSHRLHRVLEPWLESDLRQLLGNDLQSRRRRGRIALSGSWLAFPLRLGDVVRSLPPTMTARIAWDTATSPLRRATPDDAGTAIEARLGRTVARTFYTPYLTKLWDTSPHDLSVELADRRVSARSGVSVVRKALATRRGEGAAFYLYPRRGFGQISEAVADAADQAGAVIELGAVVSSVQPHEDGVRVSTDSGRAVETSSVLSTVPVPVLARLAGAPTSVLAAAERLRYRAMVLVYLVLPLERLTEFDAHYFPELVTPVSRLSEPKNFRMSPDDPDDVTVVCAEVPCWFDDETWCASDEELRDRVVSTLAPLGFPFVEPIRTEVRRIPRCYPVYSGTYGDDLTTIEQWVATQTRLLTFGRQGLFAPDNTHHALVMGRAAADALRPDGTFDAVGWSSSRESFRSHVVED